MPPELAEYDEATWIARLDPPRADGQEHSARLLWRHERIVWFKARGMKDAVTREWHQWSRDIRHPRGFAR
jgi:hypothetical protein